MSKRGNPVAIVTGGGRGIGRCVVHRLAQCGHWVVVVGRTKSEIEKVASDCAFGLPVVADVSQPDECQRVIDRTIKWQQQVDVLVNCAGYAPMLGVEQTTAAEWRRVVDINLTGPYAMARACWPHFVARKAGVIVNVSSMAAKDPLPGFLAYGAAKAGLNTLGLTLAREGATHGIRVHTISPGAVETGMFRALVDEKTWPKTKTLPPEDVADVIISCVGGDLRYTSGEVIYLRREPA